MKKKSLKDLKKGETLLTTVRKISNGKYQFEIREFVENPEAKLNITSLLNKSDERFTSFVNKTRAAWQSGESSDILEYLGLDVTALDYEDVEGKMIADVNMLNPTIMGERLHIALVDSEEPQYENHQPKHVIDKDGNKTYFMSNGKHIYQSSKIVAGTPIHSIIKSDERVVETTKVNDTMSLNA